VKEYCKSLDLLITHGGKLYVQQLLQQTHVSTVRVEKKKCRVMNLLLAASNKSLTSLTSRLIC